MRREPEEPGILVGVSGDVQLPPGGTHSAAGWSEVADSR
jgi:hypothetical protein